MHVDDGAYDPVLTDMDTDLQAHLCWDVESFGMCPGTLLGHRVYFGVI